MNGNSFNKGDDKLITHIRDGLDNLFVEIEETIDRLDDWVTAAPFGFVERRGAVNYL